MPVIEVPVRAATRRRVRHRLPVVVVLWTLCILGVGWVAAATRVGPIVYTFTRQRGVHLADVALAAVVVVIASVITWLLLRPSPRRPRGEDEVEVVAVELRRIPLIIAMWIASMFIAVWIAFETEVGPVLFVYNQHRRVRLGELVAAVVIVAVAGWATAALLRPEEDGLDEVAGDR